MSVTSCETITYSPLPKGRAEIAALNVTYKLADLLDGKEDHKLEGKVLFNYDNLYPLFEKGVITTEAEKLLKRAREYFSKRAFRNDVEKKLKLERSIVQAVYGFSNDPNGFSVSEITQWFKEGKLSKGSADAKNSTIDDLDRALITKNQCLIDRVINNLLFDHSSNDKDLLRAWTLLKGDTLSLDQKKALSLRIALNPNISGSNTALVIYRDLKNSEFMKDSKVKLAFEQNFQVVKKERDEFKYSKNGLQVPHLTQMKYSPAKIELIVHPFYALTSEIIIDTQSGATVTNKIWKDFNTSKLDKQQAVKDYITFIFNKGLIKNDVLLLMSGIDLLEEYQLLLNRPLDSKTAYVLVLPKYGVKSTNKELTENTISLINGLTEGKHKNMFYIESQDSATGYLFPSDIEILSSR